MLLQCQYKVYQHTSQYLFDLEKDESLIGLTMEISGSQISCSRLHSSQSSLTTESDLSFSSLIDTELNSLILGDELPAFEIRLISPLGRTPSPIEIHTDDFCSPIQLPIANDDSIPNKYLSSDFVTLQEINSLISPPVNDEKCKAVVNRCNSLETIFEGVFLNTPPRKPNNVRNINTIRGNLEKIIVNGGTVNENSKYTK